MATQATVNRTSIAPLFLTVAIVSFGLLGVFAFATGGTDLFVTLIESGMAWCM